MILIVFISALVSALFSWYANSLTGDLYYNPLPGLFFGICIIVVFYKRHLINTAWWRKILFLIISSVAYVTAVFVTIQTSLANYHGPDASYTNSFFSDDALFNIAFILGGIVGSFILLLAARFLFNMFSNKAISILVVLGGLLGLVYALLLNVVDGINGDHMNLLSLYLIWQVGMLMAMSYFVKIKNKQT